MIFGKRWGCRVSGVLPLGLYLLGWLTGGILFTLRLKQDEGGMVMIVLIASFWLLSAVIATSLFLQMLIKSKKLSALFLVVSIIAWGSFCVLMMLPALNRLICG